MKKSSKYATYGAVSTGLVAGSFALGGALLAVPVGVTT